MFLLQQTWAQDCPVPDQNGCRAIRPRPAETSSCHRGGRRTGQPEVFKLLGDASDNQRPSTPSQLYLAIASIFSFSVCKVKEFLKPNRPYITAQIAPLPQPCMIPAPTFPASRKNTFEKFRSINNLTKFINRRSTHASAPEEVNSP